MSAEGATRGFDRANLSGKRTEAKTHGAQLSPSYGNLFVLRIAGALCGSIFYVILYQKEGEKNYVGFFKHRAPESGRNV